MLTHLAIQLDNALKNPSQAGKSGLFRITVDFDRLRGSALGIAPVCLRAAEDSCDTIAAGSKRMYVSMFSLCVYKCMYLYACVNVWVCVCVCV